MILPLVELTVVWKSRVAISSAWEGKRACIVPEVVLATNLAIDVPCAFLGYTDTLIVAEMVESLRTSRRS